MTARVPPQRLARIFAVPALLLGASLAGLVLGLTGSGWRDGLAVALLILPLAVPAFILFRSLPVRKTKP